MTVVLNEAGLAALFEGPGVVGFVERTAGRVVENAQQNIDAYFASAPTLDVGSDVGLSMDGSRATVGISPKAGTSGEKAQRMANKQADGSFPWLTRALEAARE